MLAKIRTIIAVVGLGFSSIAQATLIGDTATCNFNQVLACSPSSAIVGSGAEFTLTDLGVPDFTIDIEASSITITFLLQSGLTFGTIGRDFLLTLGSLDDSTGRHIGGIRHVTTENTLDFDLSDVSFTADSVQFLFSGSTWEAGGIAIVDLRLLPEPPSLALLTACLAALGIGYGRRRHI